MSWLQPEKPRYLSRPGHEIVPSEVIEVLAWPSTYFYQVERVLLLEAAQELAKLRAKPVWITKDDIDVQSDTARWGNAPAVLVKVSVEGIVVEKWEPFSGPGAGSSGVGSV